MFKGAVGLWSSTLETLFAAAVCVYWAGGLHLELERMVFRLDCHFQALAKSVVSEIQFPFSLGETAPAAVRSRWRGATVGLRFLPRDLQSQCIFFLPVL